MKFLKFQVYDGDELCNIKWDENKFPESKIDEYLDRYIDFKSDSRGKIESYAKIHKFRVIHRKLFILAKFYYHIEDYNPNMWSMCGGISTNDDENKRLRKKYDEYREVNPEKSLPDILPHSHMCLCEKEGLVANRFINLKGTDIIISNIGTECIKKFMRCIDNNGNLVYNFSFDVKSPTILDLTVRNKTDGKSHDISSFNANERNFFLINVNKLRSNDGDFKESMIEDVKREVERIEKLKQEEIERIKNNNLLIAEQKREEIKKIKIQKEKEKKLLETKKERIALKNIETKIGECAINSNKIFGKLRFNNSNVWYDITDGKQEYDEYYGWHYKYKIPEKNNKTICVYIDEKERGYSFGDDDEDLFFKDRRAIKNEIFANICV